MDSGCSKTDFGLQISQKFSFLNQELPFPQKFVPKGKMPNSLELKSPPTIYLTKINQL